MLELRKWWQTFQVIWANQMAYKFNFVLMVIGPTLIFFFVKYNLWSSVYELGQTDNISGYSMSAMLRYQTWVLVITLLAQGYNSMNLALDIRMGRISSYLIYPFDFWKFHTASFLAAQSLQLVVAILTILALLMTGILDQLRLGPILLGTGLALLAGFLWFTISFILGLVAFWLEETWVLRIMFVLISNFLSGSIIPLDAFPSALRTFVAYTPFPYLTYLPVRFFMGQADTSFSTAASMLLLWTGILAYAGRLIWQRGLRLYSGAGM